MNLTSFFIIIRTGTVPLSPKKFFGIFTIQNDFFVRDFAKLTTVVTVIFLMSFEEKYKYPTVALCKRSSNFDFSTYVKTHEVFPINYALLIIGSTFFAYSMFHWKKNT